MSYATGLRVLAALFGMTIIGLPISILLLWKAHKVEAKREQEQEAIQKLAEEQDGVD